MPCGGGHIEEGELIRALTIIFGCKLHWIASIAEVLEMHALDHTTCVDVEARNNANRQCHMRLLV